MKATVTVMLKSGVLDPQGKAIAHALGTLGFTGVQDVRAGKVLEIELCPRDNVRLQYARDFLRDVCIEVALNLRQRQVRRGRTDRPCRSPYIPEPEYRHRRRFNA